MVKTIAIHLEEYEYDKLIDAKGKLTWHDFIMTLVKDEEEIKNNKKGSEDI